MLAAVRCWTSWGVSGVQPWACVEWSLNSGWDAATRSMAGGCACDGSALDVVGRRGASVALGRERALLSFGFGFVTSDSSRAAGCPSNGAALDVLRLWSRDVVCR